MFHIVWKRKQPMMIWPHHCRKSLAPPSMELSYISHATVLSVSVNWVWGEYQKAIQCNALFFSFSTEDGQK